MPTVGVTKPLRRDAEDNLARILVAARDVFAEQGYDACMEHIAARAEVGVGTLYRRFPHKADLLEAVVETAREQARTIATEVLAEVADEDAVFEFVRRFIAVPSCWRATLSAPPWTSGATRSLSKLTPLLQELLERSQRAGTVRDEVSVPDFVLTLLALLSIADLCDKRVPGTSRRYLELTLDGLRPGHAPPAQPSVTLHQLGEILGGG